MPARLFFSTHKVKKMLFRITKASLFSLLIVINVFTLVQPVFAQTGYTQIANVPGANKPLSAEITNNGYQDLFDKTSTLKLNTDWNTNPTKASELTFTLGAKFSINNNRPPAWFWNKIADAEDGRKLFVLRFCTVGSNGALDESSCGFAEWPYARTVVNDASLANAFTQDELDFIDNANSSSWMVPNVASTISLVDSINTKLNNLRTKKIYHYHTEILLGDPQQSSGMRSATTNSDKEIDTFSTSYIPGSFYKAEDTLSTPIEKTLVKGGQYQADLWYCAARDGGLGSLASDKTKLEQLITGTPGTDQLRIFGTLCDKNHLAYIRLAGFRFTVPATAEDIAALNTENQEADASSNTQERSGTDSVLPTCAWFGLGSGSFVGCIAKLVYYLIFQPVNWITGLFGSLFDFFLGYSISDEAYRMGFAVEGWKLIRDISNIFFIIILVWTGFAAVFDIGNISMKKVVPTLIINALIINFSLFATRLVIDISNVVTRVFYNNMQVKDKEKNDIETAGYKSISTLIVSSFNPQNIFQTDKIQRGVNGADEYCSDNDTACLEAAKNQGGSFSSSRNANDQSFRAASTGGRGSTEYAGFFIIVTLLATMILLAVAKMFWKVSFFFLGRTIGLYTTMIFAPFAFLTRGGVPLVGNISQLKWSSWVEDLTKYALLGPIFILFLYVIVLFAGSDFDLNISGRTFFETVLGIAIPMLIVYFLMKQAVGIAENYSGKIGTMVQSTIEKTTGGAGALVGGGIGLAAGATAFMGRNVLGRSMKFASNRKTGKTFKDENGKDVEETYGMRWATNAPNSRLSRWANAANNKSQTGSWDVRNAGFKVGDKSYSLGGTVNKGFSSFGLDLKDSVSDQLSIGKDKGKGGIKALDKKLTEKRAKEIAERIKYDHLSDDQAKNAWAQHKNKKLEAATEEYFEKAENAGEKATYEKTASELLALKSAGESAQKGLDTATKNGDAAGVAMFTSIVETNKKKQEEKQKEIDTMKTKASEKEKDRLDKYGNVKNASGLEVAMRGEYAEKLKEQNAWILAGLEGTFGTLGLNLGSMLGTVAGPLLLAQFTSQLERNYTGTETGALDKLIKDAYKNKGRGNVERQISDNVESAKAKVLAAVEKELKKGYKKFDDISNEHLDEGIAKHIITLEDEIEVHKTNAAAAKGSDPVKYKEERYQAKQKQKLKEDLEDAMEDIDRWEEKLSKMKGDKEKKEGDKPK